MSKYLNHFKRYLNEAKDPSYDQDTIYFTALVSLRKSVGGNREETKNDVRAIPEVLTVSNVDPPLGIQRDLGTKYLTTWKIHARLPTDASEDEMMRLFIADMNKIRGCNVLRYKIKAIKPGGAAARPYGQELEEDYQQAVKRGHTRKKIRLIGKGGQPNTTPYTKKPSMKRAKSAPAGYGGLEEDSD